MIRIHRLEGRRLTLTLGQGILQVVTRSPASSASSGNCCTLITVFRDGSWLTSCAKSC